MNNEYEFSIILSKTLVDIDDFCQNSFKIAPEKCMPFIMSFIQHIDQLLLGFMPKQVKKIKKMLSDMVDALQKKDYVLVRDCLTYEIRPFLQKIQRNA